MTIPSSIWQVQPHGGWVARVPFKLVSAKKWNPEANDGKGAWEVDWHKENVHIDCPPVVPGWYRISVEFVITYVPTQWAVKPRDIGGCMNFDTEGSGTDGTIQEEMTPMRRTSDMRLLGMFIDERNINEHPLHKPGKPWPWGTHTDTFHTTGATFGASYSFGFNEQSYPEVSRGCPLPFTVEEWLASVEAKETVEGWVHLMLKRRDG